MAASFEVGAKVKVEVNDLPYAGTIITYDENVDPVIYKVSVEGLGNVIELTEDDIEEIS